MPLEALKKALPSPSCPGSWLCYTSACIKSRVRDWPYDRDGNLVSHQGATASLQKEERWGSIESNGKASFPLLPTFPQLMSCV